MQRQYHYGRYFYLDKKTGYWISIDYPRTRAHRWVWESINGPIPKGYHIHHIDGDKSNNSIDNLKCIDSLHHARLHRTPERTEFYRKLIERIRPLTKKWHASYEGRQWHSKHGKEAWKKRKSKRLQCEQCGKEFLTKQWGHSRFCSNKCKSKYRREMGFDNEERECVVCLTLYSVNKYSNKKTCGRKCGGLYKSKKYKKEKG